MQAENEIKRDPENLTGLLDQFCLNVIPWYYENNAIVVKGKQIPTMRDGNDICMPALWKKERTLVAYSRDGYESRTWALPTDWKDVRKVALSRMTLEGPQHVGEAEVTPDALTLRLGSGEALLIQPRN